MKEVCLELIKSAKERFKYPIVTIYIIVLIVWNWDVLSYYFLSTASIEEKIKYIETTYTDSVGRILWPLLKAILVAVAVPALMYFIELFLSKVNSSRRKLRFETNDAIRNEKLKVAKNDFLIEQERSGQKEIEDWEEKVSTLETRLEVELTKSKELLHELTANSTHASEVQSSLRNQLAEQATKIEDDFRSDAADIGEQLLRSVGMAHLNYFERLTEVINVFESIISRNNLYTSIFASYPVVDVNIRALREKVVPEMEKRKLIKSNASRFHVTTQGFMVYEYLKLQFGSAS